MEETEARRGLEAGWGAGGLGSWESWDRHWALKLGFPQKPVLLGSLPGGFSPALSRLPLRIWSFLPRRCAHGGGRGQVTCLRSVGQEVTAPGGPLVWLALKATLSRVPGFLLPLGGSRAPGAWGEARLGLQLHSLQLPQRVTGRSPLCPLEGLARGCWAVSPHRRGGLSLCPPPARAHGSPTSCPSPVPQC